MIDVHQLRIFAAVAQDLSFTRAAERLFLTLAALAVFSFGNAALAQSPRHATDTSNKEMAQAKPAQAHCLIQDNNTSATTLFAWKGIGNGTFQPPVSLGTTGVFHMIAADVNNDGRLDILMTTSGGSLLVRLGNGTGFDAPISKSLDFPGSRLVAVSADGDAFLDLVTTSIYGSSGKPFVRCYRRRYPRLLRRV